MMKKMRITKWNMTGASVFRMLVLLALLTCWGCSQGGSGHSDTTSNNDNGKHGDSGYYSGKAMIGCYTGGAITVELADGTSVMVDIPGNAMPYSKEITLSVTQEDAGGGNSPSTLAISVDPAVALLDQARLSVIFPENSDASGMVIFAGRDMIPLKQSMEDRQLTGCLYRLGTFSVSFPDENTLTHTVDVLVNSDGHGDWQEAYRTFNALVWLFDYFSATKNSDDAAVCFTSIGEKSLHSAETFLAFVGQVEKGSPEYNALLKFRALMVLCENPNDILNDIDRAMSSIDL